MQAHAAPEIVGFDYYLKKQQEEQAGAGTDAQLKLAFELINAQGSMRLLDLAAKSKMEVRVFMDAITKMQNASYITLIGTPDLPREIRVELTSAGRNLTPLVAQKGN